MTTVRTRLGTEVMGRFAFQVKLTVLVVLKIIHSINAK